MSIRSNVSSQNAAAQRFCALKGTRLTFQNRNFYQNFKIVNNDRAQKKSYTLLKIVKTSFCEFVQIIGGTW